MLEHFKVLHVLKNLVWVTDGFMISILNPTTWVILTVA